MSRETTLRIPGLRLAARCWGPEDGRPVLGLHGWLDSAATFDGLAPLLDGVRLVALDLAGHGRSQHRPPSASYDFIYWLPDVLAAADALGWQRFSLLGHSLGAAIAVCLAGATPHRVERAVLLDGLGPLSAPDEQAPERLMRAMADHQQRRSQTPRVYRDDEAAAGALQRAMPGLTRAAARTLAGRAVRPVDGGVTWRHDMRLRAGSLLRLTEGQVQAFLRRVACPVLLVRPDEGWPVDPELARARRACLPGLTLLRVSGHHHVHLTHPGRLAPAVGRFLRGEDAGDLESRPHSG